MKKRGLKLRTAVFVSREPSSWLSCRVITPNLEQASLRGLGDSARVYSLTPQCRYDELQELAEEVAAWRPDRLVFLDHAPHPGEFLSGLFRQWKGRALPSLFFHVYGDFTLQTEEWLKAETLLRKSSVTWICASHKQAELLRRFAVESPGSIRRCPFPVNRAEYFFSDTDRRRWRAQNQTKPEEWVVTYTGRLSLQKNVTRLAREVLSFSRMTGSPVRLLVAGQFDDLGAPFFGIRTRPGFYSKFWQDTLDEFGPLAGQVQYLGVLGKEELRGLYCAADVYASLSLHHDEDFGMSPAEALSCGLPVILSDWGGYSSFREVEGGCQLIPVKIGPKGPSLSSPSVQKALFLRSAQVLDTKARASLAERAVSQLSIEAAAEILTDIYSAPVRRFEGFQWILKEQVSRSRTEIPFAEGPTSRSFYEVIYGAYAQSTRQSTAKGEHR